MANKPTLPTIPRPEKQIDPKSGETHIALGCLMLIGGGAAMAATIYTFSDFFVNNVWWTIGVLVVLLHIGKKIAEKLKKKDET